MKDEKTLKLSLAIVALNEEMYLPSLLGDLVNQTYSHALIEILLIDSCSKDGTKKIMLDFQEKYKKDFYSIMVLDNTRKVQAAGWNVAIKNYTGDALTRIDAHTKVDVNFCKYVVENLTQGESVVGGKRPCLIDSNSQWATTLLLIENSLFGSSILKSRSSEKKQYVKTMFHATYKREVLDSVGLFNEHLLRTEDNEFHYRVRKAGFQLCYDPKILSYQYARPSFKKMVKQKFGNGYWVGLTLFFCPRCLSFYHFVPLGFVISLLGSMALMCFGLYFPFVILAIAYFGFSIFNTILSSLKINFNPYVFLMPFLFFILHVCYGVGTLIGLFTFPLKMREINNK